MAESGTSPRRVEAAEKQARALELRKAGASFAQIAQALGYQNRGAAYKAVHAGIEKILREPAEAVIELELARLDEMLRAIWQRVLQGDDKAIRRALDIMERRAKYLGLDAPVRIDVASEVYRAAIEAGLTEDDARKAVLEAQRVTSEAQR